jgi:hypothetical protein
MKYLILAYGDEKDWNALSAREQDELLLQDEALRKRGDLVAAVAPPVHTVKAWDGSPNVTVGPFVDSSVPLAGFGIVEAEDLAEVVELVSSTPCARAKGAIEIRPIISITGYTRAGDDRPGRIEKTFPAHEAEGQALTEASQTDE